jgi:hypothetical protein
MRQAAHLRRGPYDRLTVVLSTPKATNVLSIDEAERLRDDLSALLAAAEIDSRRRHPSNCER